MKFIVLEVKAALVVHGYDDNNQEIIEEVDGAQYVTKAIALDRVKSVSEDYILVSGSHGRLMYWKYNANLSEVIEKLSSANLIV